MKKPAQPITKITLFSPHPKQKEVISACLLDSPSFFNIVNAGRRGGKSIMCINVSIYWAYSDKESIIWYVCPTDSQCSVVLDSFIKAIQGSGLVKKINNSAGQRLIEF